ncbi:uncharacterized protein, partial [Watersipora subatra]
TVVDEYLVRDTVVTVVDEYLVRDTVV